MGSLRIHQSGLICQDMFSTEILVQWESVTQVVTKDFPLYPCWQIHTSGGKTYYVPKRVARKEELFELAKRYAGSSHPFVSALSTPAYLDVN
jgi:hypothetical protein